MSSSAEIAGSVDEAASDRYMRAMRKARVLFPGVVGEALADQIRAGWDLRSLLGPGSLTERLVSAVERIPLATRELYQAQREAMRNGSH